MSDVAQELIHRHRLTVDLPARVLEIYQDPAGGRYRRLIRSGALGMLSAKALPDVTFDLSGLF
jgi:hypothetical protein